MKKEIEKQIGEIFGGGGEDPVIENLIMVLNLPNEQFDILYPSFKKKLSNIFSSKKFQQEVLNSFEILPVDSKEETFKQAETFLDEIRADDTLSENKKDMICSIINESIIEIYKLYDNPREKVKVKIHKLNPEAIIPQYAHSSDAGADVCALEETIIEPGQIVIVKTGLQVAIPKGYEIQVRPRSGLSVKTKLRIANAPGTIDPEYRGEIGIIVTNMGGTKYTIEKGMKIAQLVISPIPMIVWDEVDTLDETERGTGGFGSTDKA